MILSQGGIAAFCHTDVSKSEDVERMVQEAIRQFGGVDVLVQNAFGVIAGEIIFMEVLCPSKAGTMGWM